VDQRGVFLPKDARGQCQPERKCTVVLVATNHGSIRRKTSRKIIVRGVGELKDVEERVSLSPLVDASTKDVGTEKVDFAL